MKKSRGQVRKLLIAIGEIQSLVGAARQWHFNDRNPGAFEKAQNMLEKAFNLCVDATSEYEPVDNVRRVNG